MYVRTKDTECKIQHAGSYACYVCCGRQPHTAPASPAVCALSYWGSSSRCRHRSPAQGGLGRRSRTRSFWEGPPAHCPWCLVFPTPGEACSSTHSGDPCTDLVGEEGWGRWRYEEDGWRRRDGPWRKYISNASSVCRMVFYKTLKLHVILKPWALYLIRYPHCCGFKSAFNRVYRMYKQGRYSLTASRQWQFSVLLSLHVITVVFQYDVQEESEQSESRKKWEQGGRWVQEGVRMGWKLSPERGEDGKEVKYYERWLFIKLRKWHEKDWMREVWLTSFNIVQSIHHPIQCLKEVVIINVFMELSMLTTKLHYNMHRVLYMCLHTYVRTYCHRSGTIYVHMYVSIKNDTSYTYVNIYTQHAKNRALDAHCRMFEDSHSWSPNHWPCDCLHGWFWNVLLCISEWLVRRSPWEARAVWAREMKGHRH